MMEPLENKKALRAQFKTLRDALDPDQRASWSRQICQHIATFARPLRLHRVGLFWPFGSEIDLRPLVETHPDWTFFFPRVSSTAPPRLIWGPEPLEPGLWGLQEPIHAQHFLPPVQLLLVPGLAFDDDGYRLGYGKGFYDALLDRLSPEVMTLGVGFEAQRTQRLPRTPQDQPVQGWMSERGLGWLERNDASDR